MSKTSKSIGSSGFDFLGQIDKINKFAKVAEEGVIAGDFDGFIDSGSYVVNAVLSGTIYGGYAQNKITGVSGPTSTGKSFFVLTAARQFLNDNPDGVVMIFESESALSKNLLKEFGIDTKRTVVFPVSTIQEFRHQALVILSNYEKQSQDERRPMFMILDSLGMLSTSKEIEDIEEGKDTRDMTRAQLIKGAFRVLTLKLGYVGIPLIYTNHVYDTMGCLAEKTQIRMSDDKLKEIQDLIPGERVKTRFGDKKITDVYDNMFLQKENNEEMYRITMEDGSGIECTGNHKFLVNSYWRETKHLKEGDDLIECD